MIRSAPRGGAGAAATSLILGSVLALIAACSSSTPAAGSSTSNDQACTDSAHAMCAKIESCTPSTLKALYGDVGTCQTRVKSRCLDSLAAPSTGATADKAEACAQAYADYGCIDYRNKAKIPSACEDPKGKLADGAACEHPGQCDSTFCAIAPGNSCGVCATPPKEGDACDKLTSCGQTLSCAAATLLCVTVGAQGAACGSGKPCGAGLGCTNGTCQTAGAEAGAACDANGKTAAPCDSVLGLYCDALTQKCAQSTFGASGQACGYDATAGTLVECSSGSCVGSDVNAKKLGTCTARADDDGACTLFEGGASTPDQGCTPPARCVVSNGTDGKCQVTKAASCH